MASLLMTPRRRSSRPPFGTVTTPLASLLVLARVGLHRLNGDREAKLLLTTFTYNNVPGAKPGRASSVPSLRPPSRYRHLRLPLRCRQPQVHQRELIVVMVKTWAMRTRVSLRFTYVGWRQNLAISSRLRRDLLNQMLRRIWSRRLQIALSWQQWISS